MNLTRVSSYKGFRIPSGWEVVVATPGERSRLLEPAQQAPDCARNILTDYLGDPARAADLSGDFAALTISRFTEDWVLSTRNIEDAIMEVEILRARWRMAIMRG